MLESIGYTVIPAAGPEEAIAFCENHQQNIDLLLTDIIMPVMNGDEMAKRIRQIRPGIKTLYMSGYAADVVARRGMLEPGAMFLQKPFTLRTIADKVTEAMEATTD
jgi:CheY-like chemotaxis protein